MNTFYKKIIVLSLTLFVTGFSFILAEEPDAFLVKVEPSTFGVGESVDVTISAVKNGTIIKEYIGDAFIEVRGLMPDDYVVPSDGMYSFLIQDQGVKLFSKGLEIKKSGTYNVKVSDIIDESILGETTIIVGDPENMGNVKSINITSPINGSTEKKSSTNIIGSSFDLRNSPIEIYLNSMLVSNGYTDAMGNFNIYVSDLNIGQNQIQAKIVDINDIVLGESSTITVNYESPADGVFNSIEILPSSNLKQGDKVSINVYTIDEVSSAELKFSDGTTYPLDRISAGVFNKELTLTNKGTIDVSVSLISNGTTKNYQNIASIFVKENNSLSNIKFVSTGVDGTSVYVSWDPIGDAPRYRVSYGTDRNSLQKTIDVNSTQILIENLQVDTIYYFQISPLNEGLHPSGESSDIVEYNPKEIHVSCIVKGIKIVSEKIGEKYFLVWDEIENVTKYEIYRSDWEDMSDMKKVGETTETRFEYFFDKYAEQDQYAYYQVQAICSDGSNIVVDQAQKVQVGPFENTLLIIVITFFAYSIYRLYRTLE